MSGVSTAATPRLATRTFVPGAISTSSVSSLSSIPRTRAEQPAQRDDLVPDRDGRVQLPLFLRPPPLRLDHEQPEEHKQRDENEQPS